MEPIYKRVLANFIHWAAMRFHRVAILITSLLIKFAIKLTPKRLLFHENLKKFEKNPPPPFHIKTMPYCGVSREKFKQPDKLTILSQEKQVNLSMPIVFNEGFKINKKHECTATLPATYLAEIHNAQIFAETELIIANNKVLYDEIDREDATNDTLKSPNISKFTKKDITVKIPNGKTHIIATGISLVKDYSRNYFHWMIESLPRLSLISNIDKNIPLLVSNQLPPQFYEALDILNTEKRKIIKLDSNKSYLVKKLYYPSALSVFHDNYKEPNFDKDIIHSPEAINFIRNQILKKISPNTSNKKRKIFISRKTSDYRQLINSNEIEELLLDKGFEIIFPENLSFTAQVKIFSQAEIIIGQSGAGMTNLIFAPEQCKILILKSDIAGTNLHIFNSPALICKAEPEFIIGKSVFSRIKKRVHSDFYVDTRLITEYLKKL